MSSLGFDVAVDFAFGPVDTEKHESGLSTASVGSSRLKASNMLAASFPCGSMFSFPTGPLPLGTAHSDCCRMPLTF